MLVEVDLRSIVVDMEDGEAAAGEDAGGRRHRHRSSRLGGGGAYDAYGHVVRTIGAAVEQCAW